MIKPKIEIAPTSENLLTYDEAMMYCFALSFNGKDGWRMPTDREFQYHYNIRGWYLTEQCPEPLPVTPVRDLKDD